MYFRIITTPRDNELIHGTIVHTPSGITLLALEKNQALITSEATLIDMGKYITQIR